MAPFAASDVLRLQWLLTATDVRRKLALFLRATKANFNPDQPRVPAGNPDGGQWTDAGGGGTNGQRSAGKAQSSRPGRHHYVPQSVYMAKPFRADTRKVFDDAMTGRLNGGAHGWDKDHRLYNRAVSESLERFMSEGGFVRKT